MSDPTAPEAIAAESWRRVRAATDLSGVPSDLVPVAVRMVHACGVPEIVARLAWRPGVMRAARDALTGGAPVVVDCRMLDAGVVRARLPAANLVECLLDADGAGERAPGETRSAAAVTAARDRLAGSVVAIGNAPTALDRLLTLIGEGMPPPAAIVGMPVGFVGAADAKAALAHAQVPWLTLHGRMGGSAIAAAAVNALAGDVG